KPVLVGYLTGAALILISTQLGKLLGIGTKTHDFFPLIGEIVRRASEAHAPTLGLGAGLIVLLEMLRRFAPRVPGALVAFVVALILSIAFGLENRGVRVVGDVPSGLPAFRMPIVTMQDVHELLPAAAGIVMLAFPEAVLLARAFAA